MNMNQSGTGGGSRVTRAWLTPVIILAASLLAAAIAYPYLPAQIPYQFNPNGAKYADKSFIYLIALLPTVIYLALRAKYSRK